MGKQAAKFAKGQASAETLATVGLVLLLLVPVLLLFLVGAQVRFEGLSQIQAASSARAISDSINEVYLEGPRATKIAVVNIPANTKNISFTESEVIFTLETRDGITQISYPFFGVLSDEALAINIRERSGLMPIRFTSKEDGKVLIEYDLE